MCEYLLKAKELWPRCAERGGISGKGPFAILACGNALLFETFAARQKAMFKMDRYGCKPGCTESHRYEEIKL